MRRRWTVLLLVSASAAGALGGAGIRWNLSPSLEAGLYRESRRPFERGDLVTVCLPETVGRWARRRGYVGRGGCAGGAAQLGKRIAGVAGDRVEVSDEAVTIGGRRLERSGRIDRDADGRPVPRVRAGSRVLAPGEVWLHSGRHPRSLDSRVFGPLRVSEIRGVLEPVWVISGR